MMKVVYRENLIFMSTGAAEKSLHWHKSYWHFFFCANQIQWDPRLHNTIHSMRASTLSSAKVSMRIMKQSNTGVAPIQIKHGELPWSVRAEQTSLFVLYRVMVGKHVLVWVEFTSTYQNHGDHLASCLVSRSFLCTCEKAGEPGI